MNGEGSSNLLCVVYMCCLCGFVAFRKNNINVSLANNFDSLCLQI